MIIINNIDAPKSCTYSGNIVYLIMLQINPKKFKPIKNKTIPNPMRPKFRARNKTSIYFLSQRKVASEKQGLMIKRIKMIGIFTVLFVVGYFFTN